MNDALIKNLIDLKNHFNNIKTIFNQDQIIQKINYSIFIIKLT